MGKARLLLLAGSVLAALLAGCASRPTPAPVSERAPTRAPAPPAPVAKPAPVPGSTPAVGQYQIKRGDTLYSIALDHGVDYRELAQWNRIEDSSRIHAGQVLRTTPPEGEPAVQVGAARGAGSVQSRPLEPRPADGAPRPATPALETAAGPRTEPKALRLPYSAENVALLQKGDVAQTPAKPAPTPVRIDPRPESQAAPQAAPAAPKPAAEPRDSDTVEFIWPARGKLLAGFSEPSSKGVHIGGKLGDPVVAAAPGRVIYTGTGIRGYGKLIVIKHDNGFNSVYAHNREILVKQDQAVARGQKIAELGDTDSDTPKLHFEIRKSGKPVDPVKYLPADRPS